MDTDNIYSNLHILKNPPGAPQALLLQGGRGLAEGRGLTAQELAWEEAGQDKVCWQPVEVHCHSSDIEGGRRQVFSRGSMFDALGQG